VSTTGGGASGLEAYTLGRAYPVMPIPMVPEACIDVPAGPVTFVVEGRRLTDEAILGNALERGGLDAIEQPDGVDDGGTTIHVVGTVDGLEHLRFDCFEHEPHYHYIRNAEQANVVVRIDTFAEGDPTEWSLRCLRGRLPEMLAHAGVPELGEQVRLAAADVAAGLDRVEAMVEVTG
jgi:hypothetical protein